MATSPATNSSQSRLGSLQSTARALVVGLGWGALMLLVVGSWMRAKYGDANKIMTYIFLIAAAGAAGLAIWQAFTLWFQKETDDAKANTLSQQKRLYSMVFLAAGLALIVISFVLGVSKKTTGGYGFVLDNLGESIGVLFFGLVALGAGYVLSQPAAVEGSSPVQFLGKQVPMLKFLQVVLAAASMAGFSYIAYTNRLEQKYLMWLPELFALAFASLLFVACFLWLNTGGIDEFGVRLFVLVFGGSFGLILFLYSLGRIIAWRQDIVFGGLVAWQSESAWRFWTCFYLQFAALAIMFASFNLARADIRTNVHLRRVMFGYDAILQSLLLVEILVVVNIVLYAIVPFSFDWTRSRGAYSLSDASKNLISNLKKETHVVVVMSPGDPVFRDLRNLLDNCQALSNKLKIEYLSPDTDQDGYRILTRNFPKIQPEDPRVPVRGVLLINGPKPDKDDHNVPYAFVSDQKLASDDFSDMRGEKPGKRKRVFKGEDEIIKEFKFLVQGKKRKVYILQGNEEADINGDEQYIRPFFRDGMFRAGLSLFVERLNRDNYLVEGLSFGKEIKDVPGAKPQENKIVYAKDIPADCDTLIVTPTPKPLPPDALLAIERYMAPGRDGKMLVFLDVISDPEFGKLQPSGLEPLLKQHGVEVLDGYALAVRFNVQPEATKITALGTKSSHVLARQFFGRSIDMPDSARVLKATDGPRFKAEAVLQLEQRAPDRLNLIETDVKALQKDLNLHLRQMLNANTLMPRVSRDPVTVAVAVTEVEERKQDGEQVVKPRMVVVGDVECLTNIQLIRSPTKLMNYSFAVSALEWMAERENIGAQPKVNTSFSIDQTVDSYRMVILPGWLMFLTLTGLGVAIWVVRRR